PAVSFGRSRQLIRGKYTERADLRDEQRASCNTTNIPGRNRGQAKRPKGVKPKSHAPQAPRPGTASPRRRRCCPDGQSRCCPGRIVPAAGGGARDGQSPSKE